MADFNGTEGKTYNPTPSFYTGFEKMDMTQIFLNRLSLRKQGLYIGLYRFFRFLGLHVARSVHPYSNEA